MPIRFTLRRRRRVRDPDRRLEPLDRLEESLPSNLQGLYEIRYEGDRLDYEATMKLLEAFNEFRGQEAPQP